ncbi:MAG TPA: LLM class flavin-dependent oxidoreductase [Dehalococcoidia bacterium]|nr:LLM class flavin-dependent oxidoreductase [Dehalococcoidia bacterium]
MAKRLGIQVGFAGGPAEREDVVERVKIADDLGVESCWVAEAWGRDAFSMLTQLALATNKIQLGTAIVNVFSRTPAVLAMTFGTLDELSGGRAVIGLGSSGANVIEHWHGVPFEKPATRLREYIEIIDMIMRREKLMYDGKVFHLQRGFTMQFPSFREHIPTYIASITPKSMVQTGEIADGWIPIYWPKDKIKEGVETVMEGARKRGKSRADITVAPSTVMQITDAGSDEQIRMQARAPIAFYVGRMGTFYYEMLIRNGFEEEVAKIRAAWEARDAKAAAAAVSDRMLDQTAVVGPLERCAEELDERRALGVDVPLIGMPGRDAAETGRILEALLK